eukprot:TRINITY_DN23992_c0_g1_i2.p1 TRINITY_DN23992_c0_g1~~TRINITY_DN23992_c0_g1_i2.p1  ORF type:complete len:124 (-),score=17.28 TRINITY_DN23992_c0_g1_i2:24-395(-)
METPKTTIAFLLQEAMMMCNVRGKGCCFYHICLAVFKREINNMCDRNCNLTVQPSKDWQCTSCGVLYVEDDDGRACDWCGKEGAMPESFPEAASEIESHEDLSSEDTKTELQTSKISSRSSRS